MTNPNDARRAHDVLDGLFAGRILSRENEQLLRSFLPEMPKQKTLEEITAHVYDAWLASSDYEFNGNEYDPDVTIEDWLLELHKQLKELKDTPAALMHPEFLETEADYQNAPEGTIVALDGSGTIWLKKFGGWRNTAGDHGVESACIALDSRRVLRWSWGNE